MRTPGATHPLYNTTYYQSVPLLSALYASLLPSLAQCVSTLAGPSGPALQALQQLAGSTIVGRQFHELARPGQRTRTVARLEGILHQRHDNITCGRMLGIRRCQDLQGALPLARFMQRYAIHIGIVWQVGPQLRRLCQCRQGVAQPLLPHQGQAKRMVGIAIPGIDVQGRTQRLHRLVLAVVLAIQVSQIDVGRDEGRLQPHGSAVRGFCRHSVPEACIERAKIDVGFGAVGIEGLSLAVFTNALVEPRELLGGIETPWDPHEARYRFQTHSTDRIAQQRQEKRQPRLGLHRRQGDGCSPTHQRIAIA